MSLMKVGDQFKKSSMAGVQVKLGRHLEPSHILGITSSPERQGVHLVGIGVVVDGCCLHPTVVRVTWIIHVTTVYLSSKLDNIDEYNNITKHIRR